VAEVLAQISFCPRCDNAYTGLAETKEKAKALANAMVRDHLVRAQGADLDDGLHDNALELWDETQEG
jgi:hypothetical protein